MAVVKSISQLRLVDEKTLVVEYGGGEKITIRRLRLKSWLLSSIIGKEVGECISGNNIKEACRKIIDFLTIAHPDRSFWESLRWQDVLISYARIQAMMIPAYRIPMFTVSPRKSGRDKVEIIPWDYRERGWYYWLHVLSKSYGWSIEYVSELDIDDAMALMQEISLEEQFEREFRWGLTEIAYPYNEHTKKSEFQPLDRPEWMLPELTEPDKKVTIRKDFIPIGNIIGFDELASKYSVKQ